MKVETMLLRLVFIVFGILCILALMFPASMFLTSTARSYSVCLAYVATIGVYIGATLIFYGLVQGFKILSNVDKDHKVSKSSLKLLNEIRYCAVFTGISFMGIIPFFYVVADKEDAPGLIFMGTFICAIPIAFGIFVSLIYKLFSVK